MPITLKKDVWKVKDPSSGQYRGAAILSTTLPQDAAQIISESNATIQNIKDTAIEAVDTALNDESTGLIPKAEADRDAIDDSLNNASTGIIPTAQSDRDDIDDSLNNINDGIIPEAQANLATIAAAVQSQIGQGTDKTLSVAKGFADSKAAGMLVKVSNYQPGSQLDDPATSQDASQNTGYPVYKDSNRVWVKETYAELEVPTMDDVDDLKSALSAEYLELYDSGYIGPTGAESSNAEYGRTGFIRFNPTDKFYLYAFRNGTALAYAFYSDSKVSAFISGAGNLNGNLSSDDITIPSNTKYVRFSTWIAQSPNAKVIVNNITGVQAEITGVQAEINALKADYSTSGYIAINGSLSSNSDYRTTEFIPCDSKTVISLVGVWTGTSSLGYAFYSSNDESSFISGQNSVQSNVIVTSIPTEAKYVRLCSRISNGETPIGIVANYLDALEKIIALSGEIEDKLSEVAPENTTFFAGINYFNPNKTTFYTDRFCNTDGRIISASNTCSISLSVKPSTHYIIYLPDSNRGIVGESSVNNFAVGITITPIYTSGHNSNDRIEFTTGATANYVMIYFNSGSYDYATKKADFVLNKDVYTGNATPYIPNTYLPTDVGNPLYGKQLLIFGDSITDTCNFTINANDETTAVTWKNPSNSYVDAGGTTIYYSMWPKILKDSQGFAEIRNYARQGASYKTSSRTSGEERQNLQYQITVALNDKDNPNDVFEIDDFVPDIIIFALGTNDGTPNDTLESAMNKTVLKSDGYSIDVDATIAALDESKFCESARKAFMRIKQAFPMAQIFCVLPIQRANNDINFGTLHQYLKEMAERYGCIIIDGTGGSGITRDFNNWNALGLYLKDGLHPNEKGQNLMARMILSELKSKYLPFGTGFNTVYGQ